MPKYIVIQCSEEMKQIICIALRNFACLAYPKNPNSECNLVASDALLNAADHFEKEFSERGVGSISRRMRRMVKTAVEAHYQIIAELENRVTIKQCEILLKVCEGEFVDDEQLIEAERLDMLL